MSKETLIANRIVVATTFAQFEKALKDHDWTYMYSDDNSVAVGGEASLDQINAMARELVLIDAGKVESLYNKYGKAAFGRQWKDSTGKAMANAAVRDHQIRNYRESLAKEIQKYSRTIGSVLVSKWVSGTNSSPASYSCEGRVPVGKGSNYFKVGMYPARNGTEFRIVMGDSSDKIEITVTGHSNKFYYTPDDGIDVSELGRVLDKMDGELQKKMDAADEAVEKSREDAQLLYEHGALGQPDISDVRPEELGTSVHLESSTKNRRGKV